MDCSKTEVFLKEWGRMCESHEDCAECLVYGVCCGGDEFSYPTFEKSGIEFLIESVQKWSDQHPIKTRLSMFLEAFPSAKIRTKGEEVRPEVCAKEIFGDDVLCSKNCYKCWNEQIEEGA
jgi:hypothetical protein